MAERCDKERSWSLPWHCWKCLRLSHDVQVTLRYMHVTLKINYGGKRKKRKEGKVER